MIKYRARTCINSIQPMECSKETKTQIIDASGYRYAKRSEGIGYFDTWDEAHAYLISEIERDISRHQEQINYMGQKLAKIMEMKPYQK